MEKTKNEKQLFDASGTSFTAIVSQSDVARFLLSRRDGLGKLGKSTVAEVGWASRGAVVSVTPEASSVAALALMRRRNIAGVAVVDARTGKLIGNFSATELRSLTSEHLGALALPVAEMLALEHGLEFWGIDHSAPEAAPALEHSSKFARAAHRRRSQLGGDVGQEIAACSAGDTVEAVLEKLVGRRLHRLYVVDEEAKPVGVRKLERAGVFFSCPFFFGVFFFFSRPGTLAKRRKTRNSVSLFHLFSLPPFFAQKTGRHSD
jgi:5'-AMP-activated protein kinase regulatory gamma subunit